MSVDPARIKLLFFSAMELPSTADRDSFLLEHCCGNPDLFTRVRELLAANDTGQDQDLQDCEMEPGQSTEVLNFSGEIRVWQTDESSHPEQAGDYRKQQTGKGKTEKSSTPALGELIAGRYTLVKVLGEGGMGTVYQATQNDPVKRQVALKLIKAGMDSKNVLARFDAERQALAVMDHPNIARVYDGGRTEAGQPFFVMELVSGIPLTDYCDRNKLPVRQRLRLFVQVCRAVQHAHQKGIIHRDLKPSNILVTETDGRPTPKVIDFGVAKATEMKLTDLSFVDLGMIVGTPSYMSPEQTDPNSPDIDTRTDVYALGVVLYELLVGCPPLDAKTVKNGAILEILRMVREVDPPRPSTKLSTVEALEDVAAGRDVEPEQLRKTLKGDLDWIVMKALEKDRQRRYETANGLAADVQRYLNSEPVTAAPPSRLYRIRKFVNKNRAGVASASLMVLALVAGIIGTYIGLIEARRQEVFAREETAEKERARLAETARAEGERQARLSEKAAREAAQESYEEALLNQEEKERERIRADLQAEAVQRNLYWAQMHLGLMAWREHRGLPQMKELLKRWAPKDGAVDRRGWEWFYLNSLASQNLRILGKPRGANQTTMVTWNQAKNHLAEGSPQGVVRIWDVAREKPVLVIQAPIPWQLWSGPKWLAWNPDGSRLATGGQSGEVELWDAATGKKLQSLEGMTRPVLSISFNSKGDKVAAWGDNGKIRIWEIASGKVFAEVTHPPKATAGEWSPDGNMVATGHENGEITLSGIMAGDPATTLKGPGDRIYRLAWSPDGGKIASTSANDFAVRIWDTRRGEIVRGPFRHSHGITAMAWKPEGNLLATGSIDETVKVWDTEAGLEKVTMRGHYSAIFSLAWGPGGQLATGSSEGGLRVFETIEDQESTRLTGHGARATAVAWNPAGNLLASGGDDGFVRIWDGQTRKEVKSFKAHDPAGIIPQFGLIRSIAWSPDGKMVASGGLDGRVKAWDLASGREVFNPPTSNGPIWTVAWNSTGVCLAAGSEDGTILLFDDPGLGRPARPARGIRGHRRRVRALDWHPGGERLVSAGGDGLIKIWDAEGEKELVRMEDERAWVHGVSWSRDGSRIATSHSDRFVMIWDPETGKKLKSMVGHNDFVDSVAWSPDGGRIISAGIDNSIRFWDAVFGEETFALRGTPGMFHGVAVNPDGARIAAAHSDGNIWIWDATKGFEQDDSPRALPYVLRMAGPGKWRGDEILQCAHYLSRFREGYSTGGQNARGVGNAALNSKGPTESEYKSTWENAVRWVNEKRKKDPLNLQFAGELADLLLDGLANWNSSGEAVVGPGVGKNAGRLGDFGDAIQAARAIPDSAGRLAIAYLLSGEVEKQEAWLKMQPSAAAGLGDFFVVRKEWKKAQESYFKALAASPLDGPLQKKLALAWQAGGNMTEALSHLRRAVEVLPGDADLVLQAACLQAWFGREDELEFTCKRATILADSTGDPQVLAKMGLVLCIRPDSMGGDLAVSRIAKKLRDLDGVGGRTLLARVVLGMAEFRSGNFQKAESDLVTVLKLEDWDSVALSDCAKFYLAMDLFRQGREADGRALALSTLEGMRPMPKEVGKPLEVGVDARDLILWLACREAKKMMNLESAP